MFRLDRATTFRNACLAVGLCVTGTACLPPAITTGGSSRTRPQVPIGTVVAGQTAWSSERIEFATRPWTLPHGVTDTREARCGADCRRLVVNANPPTSSGYCLFEGYLYLASEHLARVRLQDGKVEEIHLSNAPDVLYTAVGCNSSGPMIALHQPSSYENPDAVMQFEGNSLVAYRVWQSGPSQQDLAQIKSTRPIVSLVSSEQLTAFSAFPAGVGPGVWVAGPGDKPAREISKVFERATLTVSGERLAWESGGDIWTWTTDGAAAANLTTSEETSEVSPWIEDNKIVFIRHRARTLGGDPSEVVLYDLASRGTEVISHEPEREPNTEREVSMTKDWIVWSAQGPLRNDPEGTVPAIPEIRGYNRTTGKEQQLAIAGGTAPQLATLWAPRVLDGKLYYAATEIAPMEDGRAVIYYSVYERAIRSEATAPSPTASK